MRQSWPLIISKTKLDSALLRQSFIYNHAQNYTGLTEVECEENDLHQGADFLKTNSTSLLQARHRVVVLNEG